MRSTIKDLTGQRFGYLEVLRFAGSFPGRSRGIRKSNTTPFWICKCVCGKEILANGKRLKEGVKKSCGCKQTYGKFKGCNTSHQQAVYRAWRQYKNGARERNLEWALSAQDFYNLITSPCHYSGVPPHKAIETKEGTFYWNGIDRIDSNKGYTLDNVVPCCTFANYAKSDKPYEEFVAWLDQAAQFRSEQKALEELFA